MAGQSGSPEYPGPTLEEEQGWLAGLSRQITRETAFPLLQNLAKANVGRQILLLQAKLGLPPEHFTSGARAAAEGELEGLKVVESMVTAGHEQAIHELASDEIIYLRNEPISD